MRFLNKFKTLRSGNSYDSNGQLEMSAHEEEVTGEVEADATEANEENSVWFSPDLSDERIRASLEPLHAQISALTKMMDRLIQSDAAGETTTASTRETRYQYESPFGGAPGTSILTTVAPLTTSGYSPDNYCKFIFNLLYNRWLKISIHFRNTSDKVCGVY